MDQSICSVRTATVITVVDDPDNFIEAAYASSPKYALQSSPSAGSMT